mmetsp:Transcript_4935/g.11082  ORF Transcript_4935/g.11082 Transcript_4935/m.11082 type:complete len:129 (-) Transcript_4935:354-740(-)
MTNIENKQGVVSFGSLTVRKYDLTLGDSPSVSSGLPLSLDWTYRQRQPVSIETYEANRRPRRSEESLKMSPERRHKMLVEEFGVSVQQIARSTRCKIPRASYRQSLSPTRPCRRYPSNNKSRVSMGRR